MIPPDFIDKVSEETGKKDFQQAEKDLYLQGLLIELAKSDYFLKNFVFKGGTCLTKVYFGCYRFSEDLDFTWLDQKSFENKTENQLRKMLSEEINKIMKLLERTAQELNVDFKPEKANRRYIELGGNDKFVTFKLWYKPNDPAENEAFIKIQLNFVEKLIFKPEKHRIMPLFSRNREEIELEYPKQVYLLFQAPEYLCYSLKEIASEKIRALLTRRGFKARDIVDLYMLNKEGITIHSVRDIAFEKTKFMLRYLKYSENLKHRHFDGNLKIGEEQALLLVPIDDDFGKFAEKALEELNEIAEEFRQKIKGIK